MTTKADIRKQKRNSKTKPTKSKPEKFRLVKRGGYTVCVGGKSVDMKIIKELLADFP